MAEKHRLSVTFRMSSAVQRRAWEILSQIPPGQRIETLAQMVCGYQDALDLRKIIREELKHAQVISSEPKSEKRQISQRALDFIQSF